MEHGGERRVSLSRVKAKRRTSVGQVAEVLSRLRTRVLHLVRAQISEPTPAMESAQVESHYLGGRVERQVNVTVPLSADNIAIPPPERIKHNITELLPAEIVDQLLTVEKSSAVPVVDDSASFSSVDSWEVYFKKFNKLLIGVVPGEYPRIVEKLIHHGLVELVYEANKAVQGIFGVPKGDIARFILNAIPANLLCRLPPSPGLPLIETLSLLCIPPGSRFYISSVL